MIAFLFEEYHAPLFAYLLRVVGDRELAEELCRATFHSALGGRREFPGVTHQRAWLFGIATRTAAGALRRRRIFSPRQWYRAAGSPGGEREVNDVAARPDSVERALFVVPVEHREALLLHSHYGLTLSEVAEALDISEGAVQARLYRARVLFREAYEREVENEKPR